MTRALLALFLTALCASACEGCGACDSLVNKAMASSDAGSASPACPVPSDKLAYLGTWRAPQLLLVVGADCRVRYERGVTTVNAPLMEFFGADFSVGMFGVGTTFRVSAPPHEVGGAVRMTVDGIELTKTDEPPQSLL